MLKAGARTRGARGRNWRTPPERLLGLLLVLVAAPLAAQPARNVRVAIQFESASSAAAQGVAPSGRVIITERGGVRGQGRVRVEDSTTRVRQTSSLFTVVRDGGEGRLVVAAEVPYPQVAVLHDYATARGYLAAGIQFRTVGTSLIVRPTVLPDGLIRVRVTPHVAYTTATGGGEVEFVEAASELVVRHNVPVTIGGSTQALHAVTRQILGVRTSQTGGAVSMVLVATVQ